MKRDMDLLREILIGVQDEELYHETFVPIEGHSEDQIRYHLEYLHKAGYIGGNSLQGYDDRYPLVLVTDLTERGHDFLSATRDLNTWGKVKTTVLDQGRTFTVDLIIDVAKRIARGDLQLPK